MVRHAGVSMGLYQAASAGIPGARETADRGVEWALDRLFERDGWAALPSNGYLTSGATALLMAGLVERRLDTGDDRYDERMVELGRFLLAQTEPSGAVLASYDLGAGRPVAGEYSGVLHGRELLGSGAAAPAVPGRAVGRGGRPDRRLPRHPARRRRGPLAASAGPLGRLRAGGDGGLRRPGRRPPAHRRRGGLCPSPGRPVRRPGAVGRPAVRSVGAAGAGPARAAGRRIRRDGRGAHRPVARGPGRPAPRRHPGPAGRAGGVRGRARHQPAVRRRRRVRGPVPRPGAGRVVPRRRDPDGRPAARPRRPAAHRRHRRGGRRGRLRGATRPLAVAVAGGPGRRLQPVLGGTRRAPGRSDQARGRRHRRARWAGRSAGGRGDLVAQRAAPGRPRRERAGLPRSRSASWGRWRVPSPSCARRRRRAPRWTGSAPR